MVKSRLFHAILLGIGISALSCGTAFAQLATSTPPSATSEVLTDEMKALYAKQDEVNQYIFTDHAKELEEKGILVNYTNVTQDYVEIGITPYSTDNADYLYNLLGKDLIKVVKTDESLIFSTTAVAEPELTATDTNVSQGSGVGGTGTVGTGVATVTDSSKVEVTDAKETLGLPITNGTNTPSEAPYPNFTKDIPIAEDNKAYQNGEVKIQIESTGEVPPANEHGVYTMAGDSLGQGNTDVQKVLAADSSVNSSVGKDAKRIPSPLIILIVASGAVIVGGTVIYYKEKKIMKK